MIFYQWEKWQKSSIGTSYKHSSLKLSKCILHYHVISLEDI